MITRRGVSLPVLLMVLLAFLMNGCEVDYYQPSENQDSVPPLFGDDVAVPDGFDWATTRTVSVNVEVDDQYDGEYYYTVELFDANPVLDENAQLLSKGVANSNNDYAEIVAIPTLLGKVYVQQTNPLGGKTIAAVDVGVSSLQYTFTTVATGSTTRSASTGVEAINYSVSSRASSAEYELPSTYTRITNTDGQLSLDLGKGPYLIDGNFSGRVNFWGVGEIYVTGLLETSGSFQIPGKSKLIILPTGTLRTTGTGSIEVLDGSVLYNAGETKINGDLRVSNENGIVINNNSLTAYTLTLANGTFENNGVATIEEKTIGSSSSVTLINNNSFSTKEMTLYGNSTVSNFCNMSVDDLSMGDTKLFMGEGALLTTRNLSMNNTRIDMGSASMMDVTNLATFNYNKGGEGHGFYGTGTNKALLRIKKVAERQGGAIIHYQGNLEIECYDHPSEKIDPWNNRWTQDGVTWAGEGGSGVVIPGNDCNNGGVNDDFVGTPTNPVFPIIYDGLELTYLFEDNWPYLGDYDLNDLVLDVKPKYSINSNNEVEELELTTTLRAIGASKKLAVGIQLDGISSNMISEVRRDDGKNIAGNVFVVDGNRLEANQTYAVIPVFEDVHAELGYSKPEMINTVSGSDKNTGSISVTFSIYFNVSVAKEDLTVDRFNVFIVNGGYKTKRQEVHMPGYNPTDMVDEGKLMTGDVKSVDNPYTSKSNLIWGLTIPVSVKYPVEWVSIKDAYPDFEEWAVSGGANKKDWYLNPNEEKVYSK